MNKCRQEKQQQNANEDAFVHYQMESPCFFRPESGTAICSENNNKKNQNQNIEWSTVDTEFTCNRFGAEQRTEKKKSTLNTRSVDILVAGIASLAM